MLRSLRPCSADFFYRYWPKNCNLVPARIPARSVRLRPGVLQDISIKTDLIWRMPQFRAGLVAAALLLVVVLAAKSDAYRRFHVRRTTLLPRPRARENHQYLGLGRWRRWLTLAFVLFSAGSLYGMWQVFTKSWVWNPLLAVLAVEVLWTVFTAILAFQRPVITKDTHHDKLSARPRRVNPPSVDVFLPVCGEDEDVMANTFRHVAQLDWPGELRVYVMDDSAAAAEVAIKRMAGEYGFTYLRRPNRGEHKKAGALNYGMQFSNGKAIAVLDADFAPARDFLVETIPYFDAADIGIVQTAQFFEVQRRKTQNWIARLAGVMQSMFFCWTGPGTNTLESVLCVGSNSLCRRKAIEAAGGFANVSGGEDAVTGIACLAAGYRTVYVPLNLAKGLCPDTFAAVCAQQYRWAASTYNMLFPVRGYERVCHIFWGCKMSLTQRLMYLSGLLYYAQSFLGLVVTVVPSLIMLWFYPYQVGPGNYLPIAPAMVGMVFLPLMLPGWRPEMLRLSMVYAVAHLLATFDSVFGRISAWVPTGATQHKARNHVPLEASIVLRGWVLVSQALAWLAITRDLPVYGLPAYWPAILLTAIQTAIFTPLLLPGYGTVPVSQIIKRAYGRFLTTGPVLTAESE